MSFTKYAVMGGAMLVAGAAALACSSDDSATPGGTNDADGGVTANPDGGPTNPATGTCTGPAATQIALVSSKASRLWQNDASLFLWDIGGGDTATVGTGKTGAILKISKATGEVAVIYKPSILSHQVLGVAAAGDDVFTTEEDLTVGNATPSQLVHISASTGAVTTTATQPPSDDGFGDIVAIDDTNVFFFHGDSLRRVPRAGGTPFEIANPADGLFDAQIVGDNLILSKRLGSDAPVWTVPRNAPNATLATKLTETSNCFGQLVAVTGGYYCASTLSVQKLDATFTAKEKVYDGIDIDPDGTLPRIVGVDGTKVLFGAKGSAARPVPFRSFELDATTTTAIGCGVGSWLEGVYDATAIYLLQQQAGEDADQQIVKITR